MPQEHDQSRVSSESINPDSTASNFTPAPLSAANSAQGLWCNKESEGFRVTRNKQPIGTFYSKLSSCRRSIASAHEGFVCAPMNGGSATFSMTKGSPIGHGWFESLNECISLLEKAVNAMTCLKEGRFYRRYHSSGSLGSMESYPTMNACIDNLKDTPFQLQCEKKEENYLPKNIATKAFIGSQGYSTKTRCDNSIKQSNNSSPYLCSPEFSGSAMFHKVSGTKLGNGHYETLADCLTSLGRANGGVVCSANEGGSSLYNIKTSLQIGSNTFSDTNQCWKAVSSIKRDRICAPTETSVTQFIIKSGQPVGPIFKRFDSLESCLKAL